MLPIKLLYTAVDEPLEFIKTSNIVDGNNFLDFIVYEDHFLLKKI